MTSCLLHISITGRPLRKYAGPRDREETNKASCEVGHGDSPRKNSTTSLPSPVAPSLWYPMVGRLGTASALPAFLPWLNFEHRNRFSALRRIRFHLGAHDVNKRIRNESQAGFSFIEILALLGILSTLLAVVLPISRSVAQIFSVSSDARNISASLSLARMLAASQSTHGRLYADLSANAFHVEVWNKTANCWQTDGDTPNTCTQATSPVTSLAQGVTFGFGPVTQGPTPPTNSIAQAASCNSGAAGTN